MPFGTASAAAAPLHSDEALAGHSHGTTAFLAVAAPLVPGRSGGVGEHLSALAALPPKGGASLRALRAEMWFGPPTAPVATSFSDNRGGKAQVALDHATASFKTCLLAFLAASAGCLNAYVGYKLEKEHHEHDLHEAHASQGAANETQRLPGRADL
mmetsp:Transcript_11434/g.24002  ORF Transcript_11434/g.24002 Transcript_11434/m.24002 type:complete len:156 (+) Transcript_11434:129-596(+)